MAWKKIAIGAFCLWHMSAIAIHTLHNVGEYPPLQWLYERKDVFRPYILLTSQWQQWNLFSPDPLRRVTEMTVQARRPGGWIDVQTIDFDHLRAFRRSPELKIVRRLDDDDSGPLKERDLQDVCRTQYLLPKTAVRLLIRTMIVPEYPYPVHPVTWKAWEPEWSQWIGSETTCPHSLALQ